VDFVSDRKVLSKPCLPCKTVSEGQHIGRRLLEVLSYEDDAVGLAANQIGLNSSVCVVTVTKPIILINPEIIGKFGKSFFQEGCLSFKGDYILTERWTDIVIRCDNYRNSLFFSFTKNALECVCVQHEIDHLNGITMFDRAVEKELFDG
jgi:peptide deformylase